MFFHLFINRIKIIIRDKQLLFWTLLFPIILATLFNMAFSKLNESEFLEIIPIMQVGESEDTYLDEALKAVSEGEDRLFNLEKTESRKLADEKLLNNEIKGYIIDGKLVVKEEGIDQTIIKQFLDIYNQKKSTLEEIIKLNYGKVDNQMIEDLTNSEEYIKKISYSKENPDTTVNYFYSLIGMACMYGGFWGIKEIQDIQANQSRRAARLNVAPIHKMKTVIVNLLSALTINYTSILILIAYLIFVLKIDFGTQVGFVLLTCLVGTILGISLGMFIGSLTKKKEGVKTAILLGVSMSCSFLSGMMAVDMKYIVQKNVPILGYLNPANLLTDSLYSLYYYETYERFILNLSILGGFIAVFLIGTYLVVRRQKYASI